ncbi:unnamed protein product [Sphagnum troendelagicum]|uniref:cytokinin riboside 5'-monophosphate phosphoribohydrolase n=1 Tax=Sphagnum troendelagicum TaxID=128251 RepID=A0ABP0U5W8_9BRYO
MGDCLICTPCMFRRICVFCGSSSGNKKVYIDAAVELGNEFVQRKINLVYGGGSIGLMGKIAQTVDAGGGHVIGVIPKALMPREICGQTVGEMIAVDDMHQRKAEMARLADAFIALPGGYGTLEELLEITTWSQLGIHAKPVGILNVNRYYDTLLALFDKAVEEGFLSMAARLLLVSAPTATELIHKMETFSPVEDKNMPQLVWGPDQVTQAAGAKEILSTLRSSAAAPRRRRFPSVFRCCSSSSSNNNNIQLHHPPAAAARGRRSYCFAPKPIKVGLTGPIIRVGLTGRIKMGRVLSLAAVPGPAAGPGAAAAAAAAPGPAGISCCSCASKLRWF